eukprot:gene11432-13485_t
MASKAEIAKQVEEIERAIDEASDDDSSEYSDDDDEGLLSRRIKQNEQGRAESFTILYWRTDL